MKLMKYSITFLMVFCMLAGVGTNSFAYEEKNEFEITGTYDLSDVIFRIYHIGNINDENEIEPTEEYADYQIDFFDREAPQTLEAYIKRDHLQPIMQMKTDSDGKFAFRTSEKGLYLILGESKENDGKIYYPSAVFSTVSDENQNMEIIVKSTLEWFKESKNITVLKVWNDNDSPNRPSEIAVELLKDGEIYETVKLNRENDWRYEWNSLDGSCEWRVTESNVPKDYTVKISEESNRFVIANTAVSESVTPQSTPERLPQTGQMNLPTAILFPAGLILIAVGMVRRKRSD